MKTFLSKFHISFKRKRSAASVGFDPKRDWKIMIMFFVAIALVLALLSAYIFLRIYRGDIFKAEVEKVEQGGLIHKKNFEEVVDTIYSKIEKRALLDQQKISVPDPSL